MKTLLILALLAVPQDPPERATVTLDDGSSFVAELLDGPLVITTEYGTQKIPVDSLLSLKRTDDLQFQLRCTRFSMTGELGRKEFRLRTAAGDLTVPVSQIRMLVRRGGPSLFHDAATVALWTGTARDLVKNRTLKFTEMKTETDAEGVASLVRTTENGFGEVESDEALEVPDGDFTIEVRFLAGTSARGYRAILSKNDRTSGQENSYGMYVQSSGSLRFQSISRGRRSISVATPSRSVDLMKWTYVAVVSEPKKPALTIYVDGKQVSQTTKALPATKTGHPLFLGTTPPYRNSFACVERIQFVRLSHAARSAESIRELHAMLEDRKPVQTGRGITLRDGSVLRGNVAGLSGVSFRTDYGTLTIPERLTGSLTLYRYREEELAGIVKEAKERIEALGADSIDERDRAMARLLEIGEPAVPLLKEHEQDADGEVRTRIASLMKELEKSGATGRPPRDILHMGETRLHGWLETPNLTVETRFGTLRPSVAALEGINLGTRTRSTRPVIRLRTGEAIQATPPKGAVIRIDTGFGVLRIPLDDIKTLRYDPKESHWTAGTDQLTAAGTLEGQALPVKTPAGTISIPLDRILEIAPPK